MKPTRGDVIVISGASSGIGRAAAHEFARKGARLALIARGEEGLQACKREVEELGGQAIVCPLDVAHAHEVEAAAERIERELGKIRVWVNAAAVLVHARVWDMTADEFERVTQVSYLGVVYGTLSALKRMRPRNQGTIIQIGSALSYRGVPLLSAYCGAQHAIAGFCDSLRTELGHEDSRVAVCLVMPSGINTPLWNHVTNRLPHLPRPIGKIYQPEVVARAIRFVAYHPRREISVGHEAVKAVYGNKLAPWLADWDLARTGIERQETDHIPAPDSTGNLWKPSPGDPGVHGPYDDEAWSFSVQSWANMHRGLLAAAALGVAAVGTAAVLASRDDL